MTSTLRTIFRDIQGNVAIFFALGAVPMCVAAGAAIDYGRASSADSMLQAATDAATLAAAADSTISDEEAELIVSDYLTANGLDRAVAKVTNISLKRDKKMGTTAIDVTGEFKTTLMKMVGIPTMQIGGHAEVQGGGQALEVALVLDNTYSMTAEGRIDALKSASHSMLDQLFSGAGSDADIKVSIVPFSEYVNVGMAQRNASWIDVKADYDDPPVPRYVASNCQSVASDGVANSNVQTCDWTLDPAGGTWVKENRWGGCVGSRSSVLDTRIDQVTTKYTGLLNGEHPTDWWISCAQEVTALTKTKSKLTNAIDSMAPTGETYIPIGLLWGWNMLDAAEPFTEAKTAQEMADARGSKALVLMTDGDNTIKPEQYPWHFKANGASNWGAVADQKTAELCDNIKSAGITIYTVALKVTNENSRQMLQNCASSPAMAFNADDNTALVEAFKNIAGQLVAVRLSK